MHKYSAAFDMSFRDLTTEQQRLFRRLGLHPGGDIDAYATAALDNIDPDSARARLGDLYNYHLKDEPTHGRYRFHDLIREYASALAIEGEPAEHETAEDRLLNYYLCGATIADHQIDPRLSADIPALRT